MIIRNSLRIRSNGLTRCALKSKNCLSRTKRLVPPTKNTTSCVWSTWRTSSLRQQIKSSSTTMCMTVPVAPTRPTSRERMHLPATWTPCSTRVSSCIHGKTCAERDNAQQQGGNRQVRVIAACLVNIRWAPFSNAWRLAIFKKRKCECEQAMISQMSSSTLTQ